MSLFDGMRRLLGVHKERSVLRVGPKPKLGAKIVIGDVRITVQTGLTDSTWKWLSDLGWREDSFRVNRRRYRDVPPSLVAELFDATDPDERAMLLDLALSEATFRPVVRLNNR